MRTVLTTALLSLVLCSSQQRSASAQTAAGGGLDIPRRLDPATEHPKRVSDETDIRAIGRPITDPIAAPAIEPASDTPNVFGVQVRGIALGRVMVDSVNPGGPADQAGVLSGDQILSIGNTIIDSVGTFQRRLQTIDPKDQVEFSFSRVTATNGPMTYNTVLTAMEPPRSLREQPRAQREERVVRKVPTTTGDSFARLPSELAQRPNPGELSMIMGLRLRNSTPVQVLDVAPASPAAGAGLMVGDVLVALDGASIERASDFLALVAPHRIGDALPLAFRRADRPMVTTMVVAPRLVDLVVLAEREALAKSDARADVQQQAIDDLRAQIRTLQQAVGSQPRP